MNLHDALAQACAAVGIHPPRRHDFGRWLQTDTTDGRRGKGDGRVIIDDAKVTAWNWKTGEKETVWLRDKPSPVERKQIAKRIEIEQQQKQERADSASRIATALVAAARSAAHPYLVGKGFLDEKVLVLDAVTIRQSAGYTDRRGNFVPADYLVPADGRRAIVIPARLGSRISSAQMIWEDGTKKFIAGGEIAGSSHRIATGADTWLCEGFATGLSIRAALRGLKMQATILCCFSASNIVAVARRCERRVFIAADNDKPLPQFAGLGTGEHYAKQTGLPYGMPPDVGTDFNDMHQCAGIFAVQRALTSIMTGRPIA